MKNNKPVFQHLFENRKVVSKTKGWKISIFFTNQFFVEMQFLCFKLFGKKVIYNHQVASRSGPPKISHWGWIFNDWNVFCPALDPSSLRTYLVKVGQCNVTPAIPRGCAQSGRCHAEARGHQPHHPGTSALISPVQCPSMCLSLCASQIKELVQADNPEPGKANMQSGWALCPAAPRAVEESGACWGWAVDRQGCCPSSRDAAGGFPWGSTQPLSCPLFWCGIVHPFSIHGS